MKKTYILILSLLLTAIAFANHGKDSTTVAKKTRSFKNLDAQLDANFFSLNNQSQKFTKEYMQNLVVRDSVINTQLSEAIGTMDALEENGQANGGTYTVKNKSLGQGGVYEALPVINLNNKEYVKINDNFIANNPNKTRVEITTDINTQGFNTWKLVNSVDDVLGSIIKIGNKVDYTNPAGKLLKWTEQGVGDIDNAILSAKNLDASIPGNPGKIIEAKVVEFVKQQKQLDGYALKIKRANNSVAGDIDVSTLDELIEVKKSFSAWSGKKAQVNKFVNSSMDDFLNPYNKKVILYIDEPLTVAQKSTITNYIPNNVTLVNSLTELQLILK